MKNLGLDPNQKDLETIIQEVDQDGNGEIDFDEFCAVMKRLSAKKRTWNEIVRECFEVFDRVGRSSLLKLTSKQTTFRP